MIAFIRFLLHGLITTYIRNLLLQVFHSTSNSCCSTSRKKNTIFLKMRFVQFLYNDKSQREQVSEFLKIGILKQLFLKIGILKQLFLKIGIVYKVFLKILIL